MRIFADEKQPIKLTKREINFFKSCAGCSSEAGERKLFEIKVISNGAISYSCRFALTAKRAETDLTRICIGSRIISSLLINGITK